jgi:uncharacterized protein with NAD-binding domain and iron-sulfur cluster
VTSASPDVSRQRIAILGGGPAGLSAAWSLSATQALRDKYDVTVYQSGWRVGGKCGQGRQGPANRIEINGTHYLFGAYDACFALAREIFTELDAAGDTRFGTFDDQFLPCNVVAMKEFFNGNWYTWALTIPGNGKPPGTPGEPQTLTDVLHTIIGWIIDLGTTTAVTDLLKDDVIVSAPVSLTPATPTWWKRTGEWLGRELQALEHLVGVNTMKLAHELVDRLVTDLDQPEIRDAIVWLLRHFRDFARKLLAKPMQTSIEARRAWQLIDLGTTILIGVLEDNVFAPGGFEAIDSYDLREWIAKWGAEEATVWSAPLLTWYNAIAAYAGGDINSPNMSAGLGLRAMLRLGLTYKGAFAFQLSWEVGDSIIAPMYQVLKNRGVRFMYFHRVQELMPSADGTTIDAFTVEQQVTMASGDPASYDPFLIMPNGRPVWPNQPMDAQIVNPPAYQNQLMSFYAPNSGNISTLRRGADFDTVVLAIPVAANRWSCAQLMTQKPAWNAMINNLTSTETQSLRLWLHPTVEAMGWEFGQAVLSGYFQPLSTWEDARQLVDAETWPVDNKPHGIATLFGVLGDAPAVYPPPTDTSYETVRWFAAELHAVAFCRAYVGSLWPKATHPRNPVGIDWNSLVVLDPDLTGEARLSAQSIRCNVGPIEAYTQIHKGTLQYRLRPNESGYANLVLAGDWVRNGYEIGSVEGAVLGGLEAAGVILKAG